MERLSNYAIALCLYFLNDNILSINTVPYETLPDDLHDYFDLLRVNLGVEQPALFEIQRHNGYCDVLVGRNRLDNLKKNLTKYNSLLIKDKLDSSRNVLTWKNELKAFINKAKSSGYNLQYYNVTVEDMHVVLYGLILGLFTLKHIDITPDEVVSCFYDRDTSGDVEGGDVTDFYKQLKVCCTVDIETFINKISQKKQKASNEKLTPKDSDLYKLIRRRSYHADNNISLKDQIDIYKNDDDKPYKTEPSLKETIKRINQYYKVKYNVKHLFVRKLRGEDYLYKVKYAENDKE